ncbi:TIGR00374 family protein [Methanosarcina sp. Ant1]|nr:TIGR00374 family protein [Methanosarcina sp. Ant1]
MNWKTVGKITVSLGLIFYLLYKLDIKAIYEAFAQMDVVLLSFSLPFIFIMYLIKARKWQALLDCIDIKIPMLKSLEIILIGTFYGALTPGRAGEVLRAYYLNYERSRSIPTVIMDKIIDIICLLVLSILSLAFFFKDRNLIYLMTLVMAFFIAGIIIITNEKFITFIFKAFSQNIEHTENYIRTLREIIENKKVLLSVFSLTLVYYFVSMIVYWIVIKSLSPALDSVLAFSLPIIVVLGNFPISISGFGLREFVSVTIFNLLNESSVYGFSCSVILCFLTTLSPALFGFLLTLKKKP